MPLITGYTKTPNERPADTRKHTPKKTEQARTSSLRRLGIHKVCLRRRALTSHLLRHFWCFAVLKLRFFVPARTKLQSILSYSQGFGRRRGEKDRFKTVCFLMSAGLNRSEFFLIFRLLSSSRRFQSGASAYAQKRRFSYKAPRASPARKQGRPSKQRSYPRRRRCACGGQL